MILRWIRLRTFSWFENTDSEWIQTPAASLPDQTEDGTEVIRENDGSEPTTIDEACCLEQLLLLGQELRTAGAKSGRVYEGTFFVDFEQFFHDVLSDY